MTRGSKPLDTLDVRCAIFGLLLVVPATACQRTADAQQVTREPLGPLECFRILDELEIADETAIELCAGANSAAPGQCFAIADARVPTLADSKAVTLCTGATSTAPIDCYMDLAAEEVFTEGQLVTYCATRCAVGPPPPEVSSSACLAAAQEQTELSLQSAGELCFGASSTAPVQCYLAGDALHTLADSQLVRLCVETPTCQYYGGGSSPGAVAPAY